MAIRIRKRFEFPVFGLLVSGMMSFLVSGVATASASGIGGDLLWRWLDAWSLSWMVAFPTILIVVPAVRRLLHRIVAD